MQTLRAEVAERAYTLQAIAHWPALTREIWRIRGRDWYNHDDASSDYTPNIARYPPPGPMPAPLEQ